MKAWVISGVAFVASVAGIWSSGLWGAVGWMTPDAHAADYKETQQLLIDFRDEWKCDEYDEELLELEFERRKMERADEDTTEVDLLIEKIRVKMERIDCSRFDDFG